jgi:hypothetical protein
MNGGTGTIGCRRNFFQCWHSTNMLLFLLDWKSIELLTPYFSHDTYKETQYGALCKLKFDAAPWTETIKLLFLCALRQLFFVSTSSFIVFRQLAGGAAHETCNEPKNNGGNGTVSSRVESTPRLAADRSLQDEEDKTLECGTTEAKEPDDPKE